MIPGSIGMWPSRFSPLTSHGTRRPNSFQQEAKAASALDHPNICTIYEINETADGQLYLVMAHYEGETLKERIARGPLELDDAIDITTQVGQRLSTAHAASRTPTRPLRVHDRRSDAVDAELSGKFPFVRTDLSGDAGESR